VEQQDLFGLGGLRTQAAETEQHDAQRKKDGTAE
jgi:hypothetical protein